MLAAGLAELGQQAGAHELHDVAAMGLDDFDDGAEIIVEHGDHGFVVMGPGEAGESAEVEIPDDRLGDLKRAALNGAEQHPAAGVAAAFGGKWLRAMTRVEAVPSGGIGRRVRQRLRLCSSAGATSILTS